MIIIYLRPLGTIIQNDENNENDNSTTQTVIIHTLLLGNVGRWRVADGSRKAAEEVPSSKGKMDARKGVRRELWQGPRNDTDRMYRMIRQAVTFPGIW